jgi:thiol-disulfide isomerase/thioredoxin
MMCVALAAGAGAAAQAPASSSAPAAGANKPVAFGERFPTASYGNLNPGAGGAPRLDLREIVGKRPVVFLYWIGENPRSEEVFQEVQAIADELGPSKLVLYGVVTPPVGLDSARIPDWTKMVRERASALKIHVPVLYDEGFRLGSYLAIQGVPSISVLDADGRLRMANAGSLKQTLEYNMTVADALRRVGATGALGTYGSLPRYYPATEMTGRKAPEFEAPALGEKNPRSWSELFASGRMNVLVFWSVDCPHCRKSLPEISAYVKQHPEGINVITAARIDNDAMRTKTEEFCKGAGFVFPTVEDHELKIGQMYLVSSTPTVFVIRPDGVIDSVLFSGEMDYARTLEAKKAQLLKVR